MVFERLKRLFEPELASTFLDDLLEEIGTTDDVGRRTVLWAEVTRRFVHDVERACRIAGTDSRAKAAEILDRSLRTIGSEPAKYFSRDLVRIMKVELGTEAVGHVVSSLYLRQFVTELPRDRIRYLNAFLDNELEFAWTAEALNEAEEVMRPRVQDAWGTFVKAIRREYEDAEVAERTDGVWTYFTLRN